MIFAENIVAIWWFVENFLIFTVFFCCSIYALFWGPIFYTVPVFAYFEHILSLKFWIWNFEHILSLKIFSNINSAERRYFDGFYSETISDCLFCIKNSKNHWVRVWKNSYAIRMQKLHPKIKTRQRTIKIKNVILLSYVFFCVQNYTYLNNPVAFLFISCSLTASEKFFNGIIFKS